MQFLFFSAQYLPTVGGVERYTHNLARTLACMGHGATVVTSALPGQPAREVDEDGIEIFRLPAFPVMNGRFPVPKPGAAFNKLAAELWKKPFGYAVINTRFYPLSVWAARQCAARGIPALVLDHSTGHLNLDNALLAPLGRLYEHLAVKLIRRWCRNFYGVSKACGAWLEHFHVFVKGTLYNAVDIEALDAIAARPPCNFRQRLGLPPGTPIVLFSGRLIREKGVYELLDAFALLHRDMPGAALVIAGTGPELEAVKARGQERVYCTGPLPYNENIALLAQSDVFCLPTYYAEGFPTAVLEAAAVGSCVITTPAGGSPELIASGKTGILLGDHGPECVLEALQKALGDLAWRAAAAQNARAAVEESFTWQRTAQKLLDIANAAHH